VFIDKIAIGSLGIRLDRIIILCNNITGQPCFEFGGQVCMYSPREYTQKSQNEIWKES
jgi:hypothetical protein